MPDRHALLGPSSAARWLACPPSARLSEGLKDTASDYAQEGTLAHRVGELLLRERWEGADIREDMAALQTDPLYFPAMMEYMKSYAGFIEERMAEARTRCKDPRLYIEQEVELGQFAPESFGTSDAIIASDGRLDVLDLKFGKGVRVDAAGNPQMRLYALGAYLALSWAYEFDVIRMTIYQPRLDHISTDEITKDDLLEWAEKVLKPRAALAWEGKGEFCPGENTCRWCRAAPICRAHRDYQLELAREDFADPPLLSPEEVAEVLTRLPTLQAYAEQVKAYALDAAVTQGVTFPGYKLVTGRSVRRYADENAIAAALCKAGYPESDIYKPHELLGLTAMEKLVGKKKLDKLAGKYIIKPEGAPALASESDPRPALNRATKAEEDFDDNYKEDT